MVNNYHTTPCNNPEDHIFYLILVQQIKKNIITVFIIVLKNKKKSDIFEYSQIHSIKINTTTQAW
jgi:hypothetical protein